MSDFDNTAVVLRDEISNFIERELAVTVNVSTSHNDTQAFSFKRVNSSQENAIRDFNVEKEIHRHDWFMESFEIFSN